MKLAIFYKSHLGSTRNYAKWLKEQYDADLYMFRQLKKAKISSCDTIIVSSGTYKGRMPLVKFIQQAWPQIKNKRVIVVAVGIVDPNDQASINSYKMIPKKIRDNIRYFKLPGKIGSSKPMGEVEPENLKPIVKYLKLLDNK